MCIYGVYVNVCMLSICVLCEVYAVYAGCRYMSMCACVGVCVCMRERGRGFVCI